MAHLVDELRRQVAALLLVVLGFAAAWTWRAPDLASTEPNNGRQAADAQAFDAPAPDASARQNYEAGGPLAPQSGNPGQPERSKTNTP